MRGSPLRCTSALVRACRKRERVMIIIFKGADWQNRLCRSMFADRKKLFVDLLGWEVPVVDGAYEVDQFDHDDALYIVDTDHAGRHVASLRLLPTTRPHILGSLFAHSCDDSVPCGSDVYEITRLCLPPALGAPARLAARNRLISAMVDHCAVTGIASLTGVVASAFRNQILTMGWDAQALGPPIATAAGTLGAFRIDIDATTSARLARTGIYAPLDSAPTEMAVAA
jgi:N-acyl-L-homoserine lactone synthetase